MKLIAMFKAEVNMLPFFERGCLIFSLLVIFACHGGPKTTAVDGSQNIYMPDNMYSQLKAQIADFPRHGSSAQAADEYDLRQAQKNRTALDCQRAATEVEVTLQNLYGEPYGILTADQVKTLTPLFEQIRHDGGAYIARVKNGYSRLRPYEYINDLNPCVRHETSFAYPSGHATLAYLYAQVLTDLFPAQKIKLQMRAEQIGHDRVLGGVHHPSDIEAGKKLGLALYGEIKKSKAYNDDIARYQNQIK